MPTSPNYVAVRTATGREFAVVESAFNEDVHERIEGATVEMDAFGRPQVKKAPTAPAQSDTKDAWVEYAAAQGMDPEQAEALTKADLVDQFKES